MDTLTDLHSRETLAGYDRARLEQAVVVLVGCGAAGNNVAQTLALAGVGELRVVDPDTVEPSNLTRAPLFRRERIIGGRTRTKARELAMGVLACSYAADPIVRVAALRVEALGLGGLQGAHVIASAVDSLAVRAYLADASRALGIPLVELGFAAPIGHVTVWSNQEETGACWRCLHPTVAAGGFSCELYAAEAVALGRVPATQTVASIFGGLAAEAVIQALHGEFPMGGRMMELDVRTGVARTFGVTPDVQCPGIHRTYRAVERLAVGADEPLAKVFAALADHVNDPVVHLPAPFLVETPCIQCGASVHVGKSSWAVGTAPKCRGGCSEVPRLDVQASVVTTRVASTDSLRERACRTLGLPSAAIFTVEDGSVGTAMVVQLAGSPTDLFTTLRRDNPRAKQMPSTDATRSDAMPPSDESIELTTEQ